MYGSVGNCRRRGRLRCAYAVAALACFALAAPMPVSADDYGFREYTYGASSCSGRKDPLNFYYLREVGKIGNAVNATRYRLGWSYDSITSDQWFYTSTISLCSKQDYNRAENPFSPRNHTRLKGNYTSYYVTASPMHHDVLTSCGDVASTFDGTRDFAADQYTYSAGYLTIRHYTGNTAAIRQCDGRYTASDGYYYSTEWR